MFRRLLLAAMLVIPGSAQDSRVLSTVKGMVISQELLTGNHWIVSLIDSLNHTDVSRAYVTGDGGFEFHQVPAGLYTIVLCVAGADPIYQQTVSLQSNGDQIELRLPERAKPASGSGTVSVSQLQHPLSGKSKKIFVAAEKAGAAGDYLREVAILKSLLNDPVALPFARMNIGVAYLRAGQPAAAIPELQEAARLMPQDSVTHTNLAYALLLTKHLDAAELECRRALELDQNNPKTRWVMGSILLSKGSHEAEAVDDLRFASREIPKAKVMLAQFYERRGQKDAAVRELREYLPQASAEDRLKVERWLSNLNK